MNSWLRALLYLFAFLLLFVWVGLGLFDAERAKGPIASWISQQTGVPVTIGRLVFNPLHPYTLLAEQVQYGDAVQLEKIYLDYKKKYNDEFIFAAHWNSVHMLREVAMRTGQEAGDGTSTATVLADFE